MKVALVVAGNDLRRRLRDRTFYLQGIGAPILFAVLIGMAFGGGATFSATIGVASADQSELGRSLVSGFTSDGAQDGSEDSPVRFEAVEADDVDRRIGDGTLGAAIVLPDGFAASVAGDEPLPIGVVVDAEKRVTADVARSIADRVAADIDASRLSIRAALAAGAGSDAGADPATIADIVAKGQAVRVPMTVVVEDVTGLYSPVAYFAPSMGMLFLFFTVGAGARSLITERREGTLQRVRAAPVTDTQILLGKTISVLSLGLASLLVIWLFTWIVFRADWGDPLGVLAVIVGVVVATTGISVLITGAARTGAQAEGLTSMVAFVMALIGGNFLSPGALPEALERLSLATPNGWALRSFTELGAAEATLADVAPAVGVLVAMGIVCGLAGIGRVRAKVAA